ncbi:phage recombination protein Bet [Kitasatospora sp. NPDC001132]
MSTEIVRTGGALAIRPDQTEWTPEQAAVLQQSGIDNEVTAAELSGFLHLCQRTQLDPFSRQIYLIGRWDGRAGRKVFTPQTGIDGYRVVAHRVVAASAEVFGYEDTLWCDTSGRWRDVWLSDESPAAAKVAVLRNGQRFSAVALFREYVQTNRDDKPIGLWGRMPAGQLAKCAEALALRKAFPHDLAGVYTSEEMAQADNPGGDEGTTPIRRLRQVKAEPDPWASDASPRDWLSEADAAEDTDAVRKLWVEAQATGMAKDVLDRIAQIGREKAAQAVEPELVEAEVVEDDERTAAIDALRGAALAAGVAPSIEQDFAQSYGVPIVEASVAQLAEMTELLAGAA